ncbi:hypothetical protein Drorol1_Dr00000511 [Drosera rotundifolia]
MLDNMVSPQPDGDVNVSMLEEVVEIISGRFETEDNEDLYTEEAVAERERYRLRALSIPGLIAPNEILEEMLDSSTMFGEKEWYFFSPRDRKYPNGSRPNRVAGSGYWKATGTDKVIMTKGRRVGIMTEGWRVGIKKSFVFYISKAPKGTKTNFLED